MTKSSSSSAQVSNLTSMFITSCISLVPQQIKAAVAALRNIYDLNWPSSFEQHRQKSKDLDLLDWLRDMFGFQVFLIYVGFRSSILLHLGTCLQLMCFLHLVSLSERQCKKPKGTLDSIACKQSYKIDTQANLCPLLEHKS